MNTKHCFAAVVDNATRLLILGSLPGEASLKEQKYYGHPRNRFWHLISEVIGEDLIVVDYSKRLQILLSYGIGLWDVVAQAKRQGSLDSNIRDHSPNDLAGLVSTLPELTTIAFNGGAAARLGLSALGPSAHSYKIIQLPSSSPAYTLSYFQKSEAWLSLRTQILRQRNIR